MNIALIAHDKKKELMVQFCIAYKGILEKHNLCATGTTGGLVAETTGLTVHRFLSGPQGGDQQIGARIAYDEIDLVLFFRDPLTVQSHEPDVLSILKLADIHNIPVATNVQLRFSLWVLKGATLLGVKLSTPKQTAEL